MRELRLCPWQIRYDKSQAERVEMIRHLMIDTKLRDEDEIANEVSACSDAKCQFFIALSGCDGSVKVCAKCSKFLSVLAAPRGLVDVKGQQKGIH